MSPLVHKSIAVVLLLAVSACVTINIYFPAAAAEKAADRIIDEVWQLREGESSSPTPPKKEGASQ